MKLFKFSSNTVVDIVVEDNVKFSNNLSRIKETHTANGTVVSM